MITLKSPSEPYTIKIVDGFTVKVKPLTTLGYSVATMTAQKKVSDLDKALQDAEEAGFTVQQPVNLRNPEERNALFLDLLIKALAVDHIVAWEGVLDEDKNEPAAPTPDNIRAVMDVSDFSETFFQLFTHYVFLLSEAKERIRKLAEWHFKKSGGPSYCATCKEQELPCAFENLCPYQKYAPRLVQEQQAWEILEAATTQLRVAPTGKVMGIDMTAALETAKARNFDMEIVAQLLKEGEAGILDAVSEDETSEPPAKKAK
ncbi:MAG: hypothetical protein H6863_03880 [Rhodospirillales bacterium]|nr:hypothetical protein [Rhodospirillales bacterium]